MARFGFFQALMIASGACVCFAPRLRAQITPTSPTTQWSGVRYATNNPAVPDPGNDQQTGSKEGDIVGNATTPSIFTRFYNGGTPSLTDGQIAFRFRLAEEKNPPGFTGCAYVGLDGNRDGAMDLFVGVVNSGSGGEIGIYRAGNGGNTAPNNTSMFTPGLFTYTETTANYSWALVNSTIDPQTLNFDVDAGGVTDRFLTFVLPFADLLSAFATVGLGGLNQNSVVSFVAGTSTQANSLNQDLNGVNGDVNSGTVWAALGALSNPTTLDGAAVPEPASSTLVLLGLAACGFKLRRRAGSN